MEKQEQKNDVEKTVIEQEEDFKEVAVSLNIRGIDPEFRQRFKAWCAQNGVSMKDAIIYLMSKAMTGNLWVR